MNAVSQLLISFRRLNKMSGVEVSKKIKMKTPQQYNNIERGRAPLPRRYYKRVIKVLGISPHEMWEALVGDYEKDIVRFLK